MASAPAQCPIDPSRDDRKTLAAYEKGVTFKEGAKIVRDGDGVKSVLRSPHLLQDGLDAAALQHLAQDEIPLIFLDGKPHKERRSHITDFFSPRSIKEKFEPLMRKTADVLVGELERDKSMRIDEASWQMAVTLVGELIGVTRGKSRDQMKKTAKRIERFLYRTHTHTLTGWRLKVAKARGALYVLDFLFRDVRPTIKARRGAAGRRDLAPRREELHREGDTDRRDDALRCGHADDAGVHLARRLAPDRA